MNLSTKEDKAIKLAEFIHCGQKRRDGEGPKKIEKIENIENESNERS